MTDTVELAPRALRKAERARSLREKLVWWGVPLLLVAMVVPGMSVAPEVTTLVAGGVIGLYLSFRWPFVIALATLIAVVSSSVLELLLGAAGGPLDEVLTVLCVVSFTIRRIWLDRAIVIVPGFTWFLGFLIVGVVASVLGDVPTAIWSQQAFLTLKGFLIAFAFSQLEWGRRPLAMLAIVGVVFAAFFTITAGLNLLVTEAWVDFTKIRTPVTVFGIPALNGPYSQPAALGRITAIIAVGCLCYMLVTRGRLIPGITMVAMTLVSVLTVRVKTLTSMIVVYSLFALRVRSPWLPLIVLAVAPIAALTVLPVFVELVSTDLTAYFFDERDSARSLLTAGALQIAQRDFPLGAGFGRYGSFLAATEYSPEYIERGWSRHYGLGDGERWGLYLTDTQWPAFLGETGWLGTILFAGGLLAMMISMVRPIADMEPPLYTWIRWSGIGWLLLITVESIGAPVFTSPPAYPFAFLGAGIVAALRYRAKRRGGVLPLDEFLTTAERITPATSRVAKRVARRA